MKNVSTWWESHLLHDEIYGDIQLKKLAGAQYLPYKISSVIVETVGLDEFLKLEDGRLPLLIGTQFGFFPRLNTINGFFLEPRIIALLSKSALSGNVAGMTICLINDRSGPWKVIRDFPDKREYNPSASQKEIDPQKDFCCVMDSGEKLTVE